MMNNQTIYLALGSNVGEREVNISKAVKLLGEKLRSVIVSEIYETLPVGYQDQGNFVNTALEAETSMSPNELLSFIKGIEKEVGRIERFPWGPREIDIDLIFYGVEIYKDSNLVIPHKRMHERDFVLRPLVDLNPNLVHPILGKTVEMLLRELPVQNQSVLSRLKPKQ